MFFCSEKCSQLDKDLLCQYSQEKEADKQRVVDPNSTLSSTQNKIQIVITEEDSIKTGGFVISKPITLKDVD